MVETLGTADAVGLDVDGANEMVGSPVGAAETGLSLGTSVGASLGISVGRTVGKLVGGGFGLPVG